jgi:hypothetical protein
VFVLFDCNRYASVRPNFNIRDDTATFNDALHGALYIGFGEFGFRHYCSANDEVSKTRASLFGWMPAAFVRITPIEILRFRLVRSKNASRVNEVLHHQIR